jgi:Spy/CpxP family protein refolding chaperone
MRGGHAPPRGNKEAHMTRTIGTASTALAVLLAAANCLAGEVPTDVRPATKAAPGGDCEGGPLSVVAQTLTLAPDQVQAVQQLLQQRAEDLGPIQQEIAIREQLIEELIASGGDPAQIGQLVVEIHQLRQAAQAVQAQFLIGFRSVLNPQQQERWAQVQMAAQLQPVVPAFVALSLL